MPNKLAYTKVKLHYYVFKLGIGLTILGQEQLRGELQTKEYDKNTIKVITL